MRSVTFGYLIALMLSAGLSAVAEEPNEFYSVECEESGAWWFRNPRGERFLSLGVSDIPSGPTSEQYDPSNPGYAAFRYYESTEAWAQGVRSNLRKWGFNTIGSWGNPLLAAENLPECRVLHWGQELKVPWCDLFAEQFQEQIEKFALRDIEPRKRESKLLGWFSDNELQWYADTIFRFHLHQHQPSATRLRLLDLLKEHYKGDFEAFRVDFIPGKANTFEELGLADPVHLKPDGKGFAVINRFTFLVAERYYRVVHEAIRKYDSHHLVLGDRYMSYCPPVVAKAAGPYVDVISTNFDWPDWKTGQLPTHYLRMLHEQSGKPVLVTEWYVAAEQNRSGNRNRGVSFTKVKTQDERAETAEKRIVSLMSEPYIVGAHWFRYADEPTNGRLSDGEDFNFGLVDIHNQPYEKLVEAMGRANQRAIALHESSTSPNDFKDLPVRRHADPINFPASVEDFTQTAAKDASPLADLRLAWDDEHLYLGLVGFRFVDSHLFAGGNIPRSHHQRLTITLADNSFDLYFDPSDSMGEHDVKLAMIETRHRHLGVRFTYLVSIQTKDLAGILKFQQGDVIPFEVTLHDPVRGSTRWKESLVLRDEVDRVAETSPAAVIPH